MDKSPHKR